MLDAGLIHKEWRKMQVSIWIGLEGLGQGSSPKCCSSQLWPFTMELDRVFVHPLFSIAEPEKNSFCWNWHILTQQPFNFAT